MIENISFLIIEIRHWCLPAGFLCNSAMKHFTTKLIFYPKICIRS